MNKNSWNLMAKRYKTTGYSDYSVGFFDQIMRLKVVEKLLKQYITFDLKKVNALDFGSGVGDFISHFSHKFKFIVGYDISKEVLQIARRKCNYLSNVLLTNSLKDVNIKFDVVFSITVLQHILDDSELLKTLFMISSKCKENAIFIALESIESDKFNICQPTYLKARKLEDWKVFFEKSGFELLSIKSFYNPFLIKTPSYEKYIKKIILFKTLYKVFRRLGFNIKVFNSVFEKQAKVILNKRENIDGLLEQESFSKIFIAKKKLRNQV